MLKRVALFGTRFVMESRMAGTEFSLIFDETDTSFARLDCARIHIRSILRHLGGTV